MDLDSAVERIMEELGVPHLVPLLRRVAPAAHPVREAIIKELEEVREKIAGLRARIEAAKQSLRVTREVKIGNEDTYTLIKGGQTEAVIRLLPGEDSHAGHHNNLGCANLLHAGMSLRAADLSFNEALGAQDHTPSNAPSQPTGNPAGSEISIPTGKIVSGLNQLNVNTHIQVNLVTTSSGEVTSFGALLIRKAPDQVKVKPYGSPEEVKEWQKAVDSADKMLLLPFPLTAKKDVELNRVLFEVIETAHKEISEKKNRLKELEEKLKKLPKE